MDTHERPAGVAIAAAWLMYLWTALLFVGGFAAALGSRPGALVMLAGFVGSVTSHLTMGLTEYRRIMRRPWPKVRPLDDDEDDW